jgi:PAS domain-containing protein
MLRLAERLTRKTRPIGLFAGALGSAPAMLGPAPAAAAGVLYGASGHIDLGQLVTLSAMLGVVSFAVISAVALMRARSRAEAEATALRTEVAAVKARADRNEALLAVDEQVLVIWEQAGRPPQLIGRLPAVPGVPEERAAFLAFGAWLAPDSAAAFDHAVATLRERGEPFGLVLTTQRGRMIETAGRTAGGSAVVRFRDLSGERLALAELEARHDRLWTEAASLRAILDAAPAPAWLRGRDGRLAWVNAAYAAAVEAADASAAAERGSELLDTAVREAIRVSRAAGRPYRKRVSAVAAGERRVLDVIELPLATGSGGIALDATALEAAQAALGRINEFHARTLDQLATPVAVFGADRRLRFCNAAYRALFGLDPVFLESQPEDGAVLDRLRALRKLPEQADYRSWKADLLSAYRALEAREHLWHLPDGQTLRVIANPHPEGGMTWIYENVTERLDLESRYNALIRMQRETLDHLAEGVAVFGSDGRLRLHNPALAAIWQLEPAVLADRPHVRDLIAGCSRLYADGRPGGRSARRSPGSMTGGRRSAAAWSGRTGG